MINFNLRTYEKGINGLFFEFALPPFKDSCWHKTSRYLSESAFSFIENIIFHNVPNYQNYGHWGTTEISKRQWLLIRSALLLLQYKLENVKNLYELKPDLSNFKFVFDKFWLKDMVDNFPQYKITFSKMISDLCTWIDENIQKYGAIYILGI